MGNGYQGAITNLFNRVTRSMYVGGEGNRLEEWDAVQLFWGELTSPIHPRQIDSLLYPMLEEALVLHILTHRLLHELQEHDKDTKEVSVSYKTGAVGWLKTQERLRLVMKEILKQYTASSTNRLESLVAIFLFLNWASPIFLQLFIWISTLEV